MVRETLNLRGVIHPFVGAMPVVRGRCQISLFADAEGLCASTSASVSARRGAPTFLVELGPYGSCFSRLEPAAGGWAGLAGVHIHLHQQARSQPGTQVKISDRR